MGLPSHESLNAVDQMGGSFWNGVWVPAWLRQGAGLVQVIASISGAEGKSGLRPPHLP